MSLSTMRQCPRDRAVLGPDASPNTPNAIPPELSTMSLSTMRPVFSSLMRALAAEDSDIWRTLLQNAYNGACSSAPYRAHPSTPCPG